MLKVFLVLFIIVNLQVEFPMFLQKCEEDGSMLILQWQGHKGDL